MKPTQKKRRFSAGLAAVLAFAVVILAPSSSAFDPRDPNLFPPEFFPGLQERSERELILAGLRAVYPQRIRVEPPREIIPEPAAPIVRSLGANGSYIRVLHLGEALPVIERHLDRDLLILDFRFLTTDLDSTVELGALLTRRSRLLLALSGEYPVLGHRQEGENLIVEGRRTRSGQQAVFTLTNHETRGPIEALLDQLRIDGDTISVGTGSAGHTAVFRQAPALPYYVMRGEIRAADGESLLESGFLPRVRVNVTPEDDLLGYTSLRDDVSLDRLTQARVAKNRLDEARLVRERGANRQNERETTEEEAAERPLDPILQTAMNIVRALQALGQVAG